MNEIILGHTVQPLTANRDDRGEIEITGAEEHQVVEKIGQDVGSTGGTCHHLPVKFVLEFLDPYFAIERVDLANGVASGEEHQSSGEEDETSG